ncbi:exported hypothetical protein [Nitrospina gracilis 3/211]|uniref:Uncharacterized protein n=1 Tax=Nitrospina gracilis (strain 3/211) TaxID=1266370 RepID=M1Z1L8_NITG3|nr:MULTISPECIES: hypothetical protein [Nitrospina]MCF8722474.1 hypothetical protein [Nitrospina sp. Nb-3]CCQ91903.1 exported hypothetical protein [Nitrospina gracilis 3/211]
MNWTQITSRFKFKLPRIRFSVLLLEKLIIAGFYASLMFIAFGVMAYYYFQPYFQSLKNKDAFRYQQAVGEIKELHFLEAFRQFSELEDIEMKKLYLERYERWQKQFKQDPKFRLEQRRERKETMEKAREARLEDHAKAVSNIRYTNRLSSMLAERLRWGQAGPWEKGLILREKCVYYLKQEQSERVSTPQGEYQSSLVETFQDTRLGGMTPELFCADLIPLEDNPRAIGHAFEKLKEKLDYFKYLQLLGEIGMKESEVFTFTEKLEGMTEDLAGT